MPSTERPVRFSYDEAGRALIIEWSDGPVHSIPFATLRLACPCALCEGEMGSGGRFAVEPDLRAGEDELADVSLVGAYGLNPIWKDGHDTGIYTYDRLRRLGHASGGSSGRRRGDPEGAPGRAVGSPDRDSGS